MTANAIITSTETNSAISDVFITILSLLDFNAKKGLHKLSIFLWAWLPTMVFRHCYPFVVIRSNTSQLDMLVNVSLVLLDSTGVSPFSDCHAVQSLEVLLLIRSSTLRLCNGTVLSLYIKLKWDFLSPQYFNIQVNPLGQSQISKCWRLNFSWIWWYPHPHRYLIALMLSWFSFLLVSVLAWH